MIHNCFAKHATFLVLFLLSNTRPKGSKKPQTEHIWGTLTGFQSRIVNHQLLRFPPRPKIHSNQLIHAINPTQRTIANKIAHFRSHLPGVSINFELKPSGTTTLQPPTPQTFRAVFAVSKQPDRFLTWPWGQEPDWQDEVEIPSIQNQFSFNLVGLGTLIFLEEVDRGVSRLPYSWNVWYPNKWVI